MCVSCLCLPKYTRYKVVTAGSPNLPILLYIVAYLILYPTSTHTHQILTSDTLE